MGFIPGQRTRTPHDAKKNKKKTKDGEEREGAFAAASMYTRMPTKTSARPRSEGTPLKTQKPIFYKLLRLQGQELYAGREPLRTLSFHQSGGGGGVVT